MPATTAKPTVDRQYWYDLSKKFVDGSVERLDAGIERIRTFLNWGYTAYTGASFLVVSQKNVTSLFILLILALPYLLLLLGLWQANVSSLPSITSFDPNSWTQIRRAYQVAHDYKERQLNKIKRFSLLVICSMGLSLMLAYIINQRAGSSQANYLTIQKLKPDSTMSQIAVSGHLPAERTYKLKLNKYLLDKAGKRPKGVLLIDKSYVNTRTGEFQHSFDTDTISTTLYTAIVEWEDAGTMYTLSRSTNVTEKAAPKANSSTSPPQQKPDPTKK